MINGSKFLLDWHSERERISPYLRGKGGIIRLEYESENAAPHKFNHFLKEKFANQGNLLWCSIRIDHGWFTTRQVVGILDELDRLLSEVGFKPEIPEEASGPLKVLADNDVGGNMSSYIESLEINYGGFVSGRALRARTDAVFSAMKQYSESGGRFMVILNDMPIHEQNEFWSQVWNAGLSIAGGDRMLLVIHAGPKAKKQLHHDSPEPCERIVLPDSVEDGSERDGYFYDDIFDAFKDAGIAEPSSVAGVYLEAYRSSVLQINMKLSTAIMTAMRNRNRRVE